MCICKAGTKYRVGTELRLICCSICVEHDVVNCLLVTGIGVNEGCGNCAVDMANGILNTLAEVSLSAISQLNCFVFAC